MWNECGFCIVSAGKNATLVWLVAAIVLFPPFLAPQARADVPGERIVQFPKGDTLGDLSIRNWGSTEDKWTPFGAAKDSVTVPAGKQLRLEISGKEKAWIGALADLPPEALQSLQISEARLTPEQVKAVGRLSALRELEFVKARLDGDTLKILRALRGLKVFHIEETGINKGWLAPLAKFGSLEEVGLKHARVDDEALAPIGKLKHLRVLDLTGTRITDKGLKEIGKLKDLRSLNLFETAVTDAGMRSLTKLTHLESLQLPGTIGASGVEAFKGLPVYASLMYRPMLRLLVVDGATRQALPGVPLKISTDPESGVKSMTTDPEGLCVLSLPGKAMRYVAVTATCDGHVPTKMAWSKSEGESVPAEFTLAVPPGTTVGGVIVDGSGKPVQGVSVSLLVPADGMPWPRPAIWDHIVSTDANGKWHCDIMPEKLNDLWIKLSHADYVSDSMYGITPKPPMEKLRDMTGQMVLKHGLTVAGRVTDQEGKPVAGARVEQGEDRWGSDYPSTRTGNDGAFSFKNCKAGGMVLTVQKDGFSPDLRRLPVDKDTANVDFVLEKGHVGRGRVVDKEGNPLSGVRVVADTWRGCRTLSWRGNTDADGRFQWDSAPAEEVAYDVLKEGYMSSRQQKVTPGDTEAVITLNRPLKIAGTVVYAENGQPVPSFQVLRGIDWGGGGEVYWNRRNPCQGKDGKYSLTFDEPYPGQLVRVEAEGYLPAVSRVFKVDEGDQSCDLKLEKGTPVSGVVHAPDGSVLAGAEVICCTPSSGAYFNNGRLENSRESIVATTDAQGAFSFPPLTDPYLLVVVHDKGYTRVSREAFEKDPKIALQAWARVEGTVHVGSRPAAKEDMHLLIEEPYDLKAPRVSMQYQTSTDDAGCFAFDRAMALEMRVCRGVKNLDGSRTSYSHGTWVEAKSGQTVQVSLGGTGCPVKGRVVLPAGETVPVNWSFSDCWVNTRQQQPKPPANLAKDKAQAWYANWQKSEAGKKFRCEQGSYAGLIGADGTFSIPDVPPGIHTLSIRAYQPPDGRCGFGPEIGHVSKEIKIADMPGGHSDTPLDLGTLELSVRKEMKPGMPLPDFEVKTLDGKPLKLSSFRGKYVLLDFWATWCGPCRGETPKLKEVNDAFGNNPKFALVSLSLDADTAAPKKYVKENGLEWTHGFLGDWQKTKLPDQYGVQGIPAMFLVDPEGKLVSAGLRGDAIMQAVKSAMK